MVDATIHPRGMPTEQRSFPTLPRPGDLIDVDDGQLYRVDVVVFGATVDVYAIQAADEVATQLAAWGNATAPVAEPATVQQTELFR
jgi:hypothetical protein